MTRTYKPMLAKVADKPFTDKNWVFEVKWDGFRALAYINDAQLSLKSRNNKELKDIFPELQELENQTAQMVLDGEIIILKEGNVDFQALLERNKSSAQTEIRFKAQRSPAVYVVFDVLEKNGESLVDLSLMERKRVLKETLQESENVLLADYVEEKGEAYFDAVMEKGLEGVMAKKKTSVYAEGLRSGNWLKIKKLRSCDCVIFGYTKGTGARENTFGALLLGLYQAGDEKPVYVGKVGTGFSQKLLEELREEFQKIKVSVAPFLVDIVEEVTWLEPKFVCEVVYQVVTRDMRLRMPRFQRLRRDKKPEECTTDQLKVASAKPLHEYHSKRDFKQTSEPEGNPQSKSGENRIFVVQEHHSRKLHYDFRLERGGVLKSWAVPKGIPQEGEKHLAVETEDHPVEYAGFEGEIPNGEYGAGKVIIWDKGTYEEKAWEKRKMIEVVLKGKRLEGRYVLVPLKKGGDKNWLMLKAKD
ncbi:MAG: non-homologous end-joining DNA ligase [Candidatus Bathyarchaeota archaeon]|nr:non-homologous end-joining DNA ligase [Candidatus Bathyarchaeota archaeon]